MSKAGPSQTIVDEDEDVQEKKSTSSSSSNSVDQYGQLETSDPSEQEAEDDYGTFEPKEWHEEFLELLPKLAHGEKVDKKCFEGELVIPTIEEEKKVKLGDYIRERVMEVDKKGGEANVFEEEERPKKETIVEEQGRLLKEFHQKADEMSEDDDLLITKQKPEPINVDEELEQLDDNAKQYWTKSDNPDDEFLKKYILEKKWEEIEDGKEDVDLDEDQKAVDAEDDFEAEQRLGIVSYGRIVKDSLRKEHNKRKEQRERRKAKKEEEKRKAMAITAEQKKEQKKKIEERIKELQKDAGVSFDQHFMDEDFDESKYDEMMEKQFGDDYYNQEDDGIEALRAEIAGEMKKEGQMEEEYPMEEENEEEGQEIKVNNKSEKKRNKKDKLDSISVERSDGTKERVDISHLRGKDKKLDKMIDDYYGMDFEDIVNGEKTRFPYINVPKDDSGLTAYDILCLDDKELNQMLSLKRLAPYDERKITQAEKERIQRMKESLYEDGKKPRLNNKHSSHGSTTKFEKKSEKKVNKKENKFNDKQTRKGDKFSKKKFKENKKVRKEQ
ncbi:hypothetical protein ENUP19_0219G0042 [Entamoeba nuttalli]|uniref:Krr1 family protein n=2 Tax=Entamoeba nuttalli TaxID=412467 RepID=K2H0R8_ENTNP|nr:Krr1 family protein [Entamoeba nuttalli P19]EKE39852.1 Krr1 family protein [Entamoeba nuttalli P19]|eukprot:XP_008857816.1 Krr1 family protein [Entamoeba nuttalli P19]